MLRIAAIGACLGAIVLWQFAVIAALRFLGIKLPLSVAFHIYPRREHELLAAFKGRRKDTFIFISGFLLFACPLFVGLTAYDLIIKRSVGYRGYGLGYVVGSVAIFFVMTACGLWTSASSWNKYCADASPHSC